jgi:gas vesicle protein
MLANAPRPNPGAVAGVAAGAAAAMTLADPDAASRGPEKKKDNGNQKPIKVKEHVTSDVLDRADARKAAATQPSKDPANPEKPAEQPKGALDFGSP